MALPVRVILEELFEEKKSEYKRIETSDEAKLDSFILTFPLKTSQCIDKEIARIDAEISKIRQKNFTYVKTNYHQEKTLLVKDHSGNSPKDPTDPNELSVQKLMHLRGMLIIAKKSKRNNFLPKIRHAWNKIQDSQDPIFIKAAFTKVLKEELKLSDTHAKNALFMATTLGIQSNKNFFNECSAICTISKSSNTTTTEISQDLEVQGYEDEFKEEDEFKYFTRKPWFKNALQRAGFSPETKERTWLHEFYSNPDNQHVAAFSNSRWQPQPSHLQKIDIHVKTTDEKSEINYDFIRMGTTTAFDADKKTQAELAKKQLKEIFKTHIIEAIKNYKEKYQAILPSNGNSTFYFDYQNLLSPLLFESALYNLGHKDNNEKFVLMTQQAMRELEREYNEEKHNEFEFIKTEAEKEKINIRFCYSNAAINDKADYEFVRLFTSTFQDDHYDQTILDEVAILKTWLPENSSINPDLRKEIELRIQAAYLLKLLIENKPPYSQLDLHQRNLMQATLRSIARGAQGLKLVGCKSGRDRTETYFASVKTTLENFQAAYHWETLDAGIRASLRQGHHSRSMLRTVASTKPDDVRKDLLKSFVPPVQEKINKNKQWMSMHGGSKKKKILKKFWNFKAEDGLMMIIGKLLFGCIKAILSLIPLLGVGIVYLTAKALQHKRDLLTLSLFALPIVGFAILTWGIGPLVLTISTVVAVLFGEGCNQMFFKRPAANQEQIQCKNSIKTLKNKLKNLIQECMPDLFVANTPTPSPCSSFFASQISPSKSKSELEIKPQKLTRSTSAPLLIFDKSKTRPKPKRTSSLSQCQLH